MKASAGGLQVADNPSPSGPFLCSIILLLSLCHQKHQAFSSSSGGGSSSKAVVAFLKPDLHNRLHSECGCNCVDCNTRFQLGCEQGNQWPGSLSSD